MERENLKGRIDWVTTLIPFVIVLAMMLVFMLIPTQSKLFVDTLRSFFGDTIGIYYAILGIGCVLLALYLALKDKYGNIKLWACGHTHQSYDGMLHNVHVVRNPIGYRSLYDFSIPENWNGNWYENVIEV